MTATSTIIYHEKQIRELCALHALNNLFQAKGAFTKTEFDSICVSLSPENWINPHKSLLGLGNYDINVIMKALQNRGYEAIWFDKRKDPSCLNLKNIEGFILNIPSDYKIGFITIPLGRRHWIALKKINGQFYNLDSKLESPLPVGEDIDFQCYLREELDSPDKELFSVVTNEVSEKQSWIKEGPSNVDSQCVTLVQLKDLENDDLTKVTK